jgi:hypothetical protein
MDLDGIISGNKEAFVLSPQFEAQTPIYLKDLIKKIDDNFPQLLDLAKLDNGYEQCLKLLDLEQVTAHDIATGAVDFYQDFGQKQLDCAG